MYPLKDLCSVSACLVSKWRRNNKRWVGSSLLSFVCCFVSWLLWQNKSTTWALSVGIVVILANIDVIQTPKCYMRSSEDVREDETLHYSGDNNIFFLCIQVVVSVGLQLGSKTDFFSAGQMESECSNFTSHSDYYCFCFVAGEWRKSTCHMHILQIFSKWLGLILIPGGYYWL